MAHVLTDSDVQELLRIRSKLDRILGPGVVNAPDSVTINPPTPIVRQAAQQNTERRTAFPIKAFLITDAVQDGGNFRWVYEGDEYHKASAGYGGWAAKDGGLTGVALYSLKEDQQTSTIAGDVDTDGADYPDGFTPIPITVGDLVYAKREVLDDGTVEWWIINVQTAHDGTCEA